MEAGSDRPIRQPPRCIPFVHKEEARKLLKDMEDQKITQPSKSLWVSRVVLERKKDGSVHFCVDYTVENSML